MLEKNQKTTKTELELVSVELHGLERLCLGEMQPGGWNEVLGWVSGSQCETWGEQIIPFASRKVK